MFQCVFICWETLGGTGLHQSAGWYSTIVGVFVNPNSTTGRVADEGKAQINQSELCICAEITDTYSCLLELGGWTICKTKDPIINS